VSSVHKGRRVRRTVEEYRSWMILPHLAGSSWTEKGDEVRLLIGGIWLVQWSWTIRALRRASGGRAVVAASSGTYLPKGMSRMQVGQKRILSVAVQFIWTW
jgi:hypothetical protein